MDNLNLDIDTYSLEDLSKLFHLKDEYNEIDIDNEKQTLLLQLRDIGDIGVEKKRNITFFIDCAAGRLITLANDNKTDENQGTWSQLKNDTIQEGSHTIIENPNIKAGQVASFSDGRTAGSNNTPPGFLNPINVKSIARGVNIDSRFRDNYYSTHSHDYVVSLPDTYRKVTEMRIGSIELPMTMYAISKHSGNNTFVIKDASDNKAWLLTVPDGNYEISWQDQSVAQDIITTMNQAISLALPGTIDECGKFVIDLSMNPLDPTRDICYTIDRNTGRSIFANVINENQIFAMKTNTDIIAKIIELSNNELSNNELSINDLSNNITSTKINIKTTYNDCDVTLYEISYNDLTHTDLEKVYLETRKQTKIINKILIDSSYSEANKLIKINDIVKDVRSLNNTINIIDTQINNSDVGNIIDAAINLQEISEKIIYNYKNISDKLQKIDDSTVNLNNIKYKNTEKFFDARYNYKNAEVHKTKSLSDASKNLEDATFRYENLQNASLATLEIFKYFDLSNDDVSKLRHYIPGYDVSLVSMDPGASNVILTEINNLKASETIIINYINNSILEAINNNNLYLMGKDMYKFIDDIIVNDVSDQNLYTYNNTAGWVEEIIDGSNNFNEIFRIESLLKFLEDISINNVEINVLKKLINDKYIKLLYYECALRFANMLKIMEDNDIIGGSISDNDAFDVLQNSEKRKNDLLNLIQIYEKNLSNDDCNVFDLYGNHNIDISENKFDLLNKSFDLSKNIFEINSPNLFSLLELVLEVSGNSINSTFDISAIIIDNSFNIQGGNFYQNISVDSSNIDIINVYISEQDWDVAKENIKKCYLIFLNYENYTSEVSVNPTDIDLWNQIENTGTLNSYQSTDNWYPSKDVQHLQDDLSILTEHFNLLRNAYSIISKNSINSGLIFNEDVIDNSTNRIIYKENDDMWYINIFNKWMLDETLSDNNNLNKYNNYTKRLIKQQQKVKLSFEYTPLMLKSSQIDVINFDDISNNLNNFDNLVTNSDKNTFYNKNTIEETYNIELDETESKVYFPAYFGGNIANTKSSNIRSFNYYIGLLAEYPTKYDELQTRLDETYKQQEANLEKSGLLLLASDAYYNSISDEDTINNNLDNVMEREFEKSDKEKIYIKSLTELAVAENVLKELDNDYNRLMGDDGLWKYLGTDFGVYEIKKNWDIIYLVIKKLWGVDSKSHTKALEILSCWWFGKFVIDPNDTNIPGDSTRKTHIIEDTYQCMDKYFKVILNTGVDNPGEDFSLSRSTDISSVEIRGFDYDKVVTELIDNVNFTYPTHRNLLIQKLNRFKIEQSHFNALMTNLLQLFLKYEIETHEDRNRWFYGIIGYNTRTSWATNAKNVKDITQSSWWGERDWKVKILTSNSNDQNYILSLLTDAQLKTWARIEGKWYLYANNLEPNYKGSDDGHPRNGFSRHEEGFTKGGYTYLFKYVKYDFMDFYWMLKRAIDFSVSSNGGLKKHKDASQKEWEDENEALITKSDESINFFLVEKVKLQGKHKKLSTYYKASLKKQEYILKTSHSLFSRYNNDTITNFDNIVFNCSNLLSSSISSLAYEIYHIETKINACKLNKLTRLQISHMYAEMATDVTGMIVEGIVHYAGLASSVTGPAFVGPLIIADIFDAVATGIEMKLRSDVGLASADADRRMALKDIEKSSAELEVAIEEKHNSKVKFLSSINDFLNNGVIIEEKMHDASTQLIDMKSILDNNVKTYETEVEKIAKHTFCKVISENQLIELESIKNIESQFIEIADIIENNKRQILEKNVKLVNFGTTITNFNKEMITSFASIVQNDWELLFNVDVNGNVDFTENLQLRLGWMLGFRAGCYKPDNVDGAAVTSEGICLVSPPRYLFISINDGQKSQGTGLIAAYSQSSLDSNIMTRINCAATMDSTKVFKCASDVGLSNQLNRTRQYFGPVNISRLHIQVLDEYGRHVSLNHMDWSLTLVFDQLYD